MSTAGNRGLTAPLVMAAIGLTGSSFFFCQIEALETAIYLTEVARKYDPWIDNTLRVANEGANPGLFRIAFKMATGTGKNHCVAGVEQARQLKRPALLRRLSDFGAWHHHS